MQSGMTQTPSLNGWLGGIAAGVVAFGVATVLFDFGFYAAAFCAAVLTVIVGAILGLPLPPLPPPGSVQIIPPVLDAPAARRGVADAAEVPLAPAAAPVETSAPARPVALAAARGACADDLKRIKGIGPKLEEMCNSLGFYHYDQIAAWTEAELAWVDENIEGFRGRATRDEWVAQAKVLAGGGETDFSERADRT